MRLASRLGLVFGVGALIAVVSVGTLAFFLAESEIISAADQQLIDRAERLAALNDIAERQPNLSAEELEQLGQPPGLAVITGGVEAYDADGELVLGDLGLLEPDDVMAIVAAPIGDPEDFTVDDRDFRIVAGAIPAGSPSPVEGVAVIVLYEDVTSQRQGLDRLQRRIALAASIAFVTLAAAGWFVGRRLAKPLSELSEASTELARLEAVPDRLVIDRSDEVGQLATSFNRLISALEIAREQQQRLVADASHELRTPLTALRMRIEFLATNDDVTTSQRQSLLDDAVGDLEQLSALVGELVDLAADIRGGEEAPERVELASLLGEVTERAASAQGREIELVVDGSAAVVRPAMIRRAVQNLIDNAAKYSPDDSPITVRLHDGAIEVSDAGPGIPEHERHLVFDRFYRSPQARKRPGNGIGLAIVQQVADTHGGSTWASESPGGGATVGFSVPTR
ncbi:MAG: HAMP domain-containing sensor histidine kinase [Actinomycetota bacterium]